MSPLIGCGGFANKEDAVSTTGHGESIMTVLLAREVVYNMEAGHPLKMLARRYCKASLVRGE